MSSTAGTNPAASATASGTTPAGTAPAAHGTIPLNKLIETPEFAWFAAHAVSLVAFVLGLVFRRGVFGSFLNKLFFLAQLVSFGLILFQKYGTKINARSLAVDDSAHYLGITLLWLLVSHRKFTTLPFFIYSLFHALTYARAYLLPSLGHPQTSAISKQIEAFIKTRNNQLSSVAAYIELIILVSTFLSLFSFKKANFLVFALYAVFFRFRYAVSAYTRAAVHTLEVRVDQATNNNGLPPAVKEGWLKFKAVVAQIPGPSKLN